GSAWAVPSQEDIDLCNTKAAEVSARTSKGSHQTPPPAATEQSTVPSTDDARLKPDAGNGGRQPEDEKAPGMSTFGMAPIGERDGVYRFAYAVCLRQHGE